MDNPTSTRPLGPTINRVSDLMEHSGRFAFKGSSGLARAAGVSTSTITRLIRGEVNPHFALVARVTEALEQEFQMWIDPRNVFAESGRFLTEFTCDVVGCRRCLPNVSRDDNQEMRQEWKDVERGKWVTSKYPHGLQGKEGE